MIQHPKIARSREYAFRQSAITFLASQDRTHILYLPKSGLRAGRLADPEQRVRGQRVEPLPTTRVQLDPDQQLDRR